jgi:hypothetical protein
MTGGEDRLSILVPRRIPVAFTPANCQAGSFSSFLIEWNCTVRL